MIQVSLTAKNDRKHKCDDATAQARQQVVADNNETIRETKYAKQADHCDQNLAPA